MRASRTKRRPRPRRRSRDGGQHLEREVAPQRVSRARYTSPIPPLPRVRGSRTVPHERLARASRQRPLGPRARDFTSPERTRGACEDVICGEGCEARLRASADIRPEGASGTRDPRRQALRRCTTLRRHGQQVQHAARLAARRLAVYVRAPSMFVLPVAIGISIWVFRQMFQEVCPWNVRFARELPENSPFKPREVLAGKDARTSRASFSRCRRRSFPSPSRTRR